MDKITVKGARVHNLKNIDVEIPRGQLVVITGLSGSGKSSLAFDTIYAEGQRRYVESLSAYARQFLGQMDKPDVDYIEGLSPAISIDQKTTTKNPRSTVGTVTEIYDYLRLLYARIGHPHCPHCGRPVSQQTVEQIVDRLMSYPEGTRLQVMAPLVRGRKGEYNKLLQEIREQGYVRVRIDGKVYELYEEILLEKNKKHTIEVVVDRLVVRAGVEGRMADSLETAGKLAEGLIGINLLEEEDLLFSRHFACPECGINLEEITPRLFSFNSPYGACTVCNGLGTRQAFDPELIVPNPGLALRDGAIAPLNGSSAESFLTEILDAAAVQEIPLDVPFRELALEQKNLIFYGSPAGEKAVEKKTRRRKGAFPAVIPYLEKRYRAFKAYRYRAFLEQYISTRTCAACRGTRLKPESLAVTVGGLSINQVTSRSIREAKDFFAELAISPRETSIANQVLKEIQARLDFLVNVGLDYLTLERPAATLSGGEAQRIRLATQIGSGLVGVLYILDEPSIGLHQRDNKRLLNTLKRLRDLGNTVIVVEHDEETMLAADYIIDIGPGAGAHGGRVIAEGPAEVVSQVPESITGAYLSGRRRIDIPLFRRPAGEKYLEITGAQANNLKNLDVRIPLGLMVCVTGVSGSGKSTLINEILYPRAAKELQGSRLTAGKHCYIKGLEHLDKVLRIDQSPIGRTPRSNPATYTGVFNGIRELYARTSESKVRGYRPGRFSFNVEGGRCEACRGDGIIKIEMHFLPDVYVPCEVCKGQRYNRETLEIKYKGKNISDVLKMTVDEAAEFFRHHRKIYRMLEIMQDVGLGYLKLGQPATTLSGGEAQRIKLASELGKRSNGGTLYLLDEPTTGLHKDDILKLLRVLNRLVEGGGTVVVIEHNLDVIKCADYLIDLGPEGGDAGGQLVAAGTPEEVARCPQSFTGRFLQNVLEGDNGGDYRKTETGT